MFGGWRIGPNVFAWLVIPFVLGLFLSLCRSSFLSAFHFSSLTGLPSSGS